MRVTKNFILYKFDKEGDYPLEDDDGLTKILPAGWFKIRESGHQYHGLSYKYPLKHPDYSEELQQRLMDLETGDLIHLRLTPIKGGAAYRVYEYKEHSYE